MSRVRFRASAGTADGVATVLRLYDEQMRKKKEEIGPTRTCLCSLEQAGCL